MAVKMLSHFGLEKLNSKPEIVSCRTDLDLYDIQPTGREFCCLRPAKG